jgi:glycosyltransferase involved in cell wall biosynthesis
VHYGDNWIRGSERCLLDLLTHIDRKKFRVLVWCNSTVLKEELANIGINAGVDEFSIIWGYHHKKWDFVNWGRLVGKTMSLISEKNIDVVHANSGGPVQWTALACRILNKPLVTQLHAKYGVAKDRYTLLIHQSTKIVGVSRATLVPIRNDHIDEKKTQVIYNGIDFNRLASQKYSTIRSLLNIGQSDIVLATVGSLIPRKGVLRLVNTVKRLHKQGHKVHLLVIGEGSEREEIESAIAQFNLSRYIHLLGERSNAFSIIRDNADIYLSAADDEVFGLVLAEAGYAGLPVVAYGVGGIPEVVSHGETGWLADLEDENTYCQHIIHLIDNPVLRRQMGEVAKDYVTKNFSIASNTASFEKLYMATVKQKFSNENLIQKVNYFNRIFSLIMQRIYRSMTRVIKSYN